MQTLGASNPHNNNKEKHRGAPRITGDTVDRVFTPNGGLDNGVRKRTKLKCTYKSGWKFNFPTFKVIMTDRPTN